MTNETNWQTSPVLKLGGTGRFIINGPSDLLLEAADPASQQLSALLSGDTILAFDGGSEGHLELRGGEFRTKPILVGDNRVAVHFCCRTIFVAVFFMCLFFDACLAMLLPLASTICRMVRTAGSF